jgi:hypothetical protein
VTFDIPPGAYEIISGATFQFEAVVLQDTGIVYGSRSPPPPPTLPEEYDEYGRFEFRLIKPIQIPMFPQPYNLGYWYYKLYTLTVYNTVQTHVMPGENDQAFVCIPNDKEFLRISAARNLVDLNWVDIDGYDPLEPNTNMTATIGATKATNLFFGELLGSQLMGGLAGMASGQATTFLYLGTTPNNDLDDYVRDLGTSGAVATAGFLLSSAVGGGVPGFLVGVGVSVVGSYIPAMIREENLRSHVASSVKDDLLVALDPANHAVRISNNGPNLMDVELIVEYYAGGYIAQESASDTFIATLDSGESEIIGNVDEAFFQSFDEYGSRASLLFDCALIPGYKEVTGIYVPITDLRVSPQPGMSLGEIQLSLASHADLHVYDSTGRHMGINYDDWTLEQNIPDATFIFEDPSGIQQPLPGDGYIPTDWVQIISLPAIEGVNYRTELVGTSEGPFELTISGFQNGELTSVQTYRGDIVPGQLLATSTNTLAIEGQMTLLYELLGNGSAMGLEPDVLTFMLHPGTQELTFIIIEDTGRQTLDDVTVSSSDIIGANGLIDGSTVSFDMNHFDVAPGGQQVVHAFISVPLDFVGPASGKFLIESADGETKSIDMIAVSNQPPSFVAGPNQIAEEDAGPLTVDGWASVIAHETPADGNVTLTFEVTNDNTALFSSQPAISSDGTLTFETASNAYGSATVTVVLRDDEGTDCGGIDSSVPATFSILITSVNDAPTADAGPDQPTVERTSAAGTEVTLDGSGSSDPDGDSLTYEWTWAGGSTSGANPTVTLPPGLTTVTLVVSDGQLSDTDAVDINVADTTPPHAVILFPYENAVLQDGTTLMADANDVSVVTELYFYIREPNDGSGIPIGQEDLAAVYNDNTDLWECPFNTTVLDDGFYVILAKAVDSYGNEGWSGVVPFSIRNWAALELLPSSEEYRAGRTVPIKFSLRIAEAVDPAMPFVYNEQLEIRIYKASEPGNILQTSLFGDTSTDYRINTPTELYITNFRTDKKPTTYAVEIWRTSKNFGIGGFIFETTRK